MLPTNANPVMEIQRNSASVFRRPLWVAGLLLSVVVAFVLVLSIVVTLVPGLHARTVSPGEYPYDD